MPDFQRRQYGDDESESFFCRFTFGQFFAILLLEVFTLFFVFYLGARYGQEFLGLDRPSALASGDAHHKKSLEVESTADPEVAKMADELIAQAKAPELKERIAGMLGTEPTMKPAPRQEAVMNSTGAGETKTAAPKVSPAPERSAPQENGAVNGAVRIKSGEAARYAIQVGSFPNLDEANASVARWKERGYPAYMMIADIPDRGRWYRIRIGGFESRTDAEAYMNELTDREDVEALIVLNEQ